MTTPKIDTSFTPDYRSASWRAFLASGLWLRAGFIGASVFAVAVIALFSGEWSPMTALASALGGGLFAAYAWRQSWLVIERADWPEESLPASVPVRLSGLAPRVESTASH